MTGPDDSTVQPKTPPTALPKKIGPYAIKRRIGSGGMGVIYEAVQESPRRAVAIKVMRHGVDSLEAKKRFEYESQLLARLSHPGIAQVYSAGTHREADQEIPYFAMEYIPNAGTLTAFAEEKHLSTRERVELFIRICGAVHHGHQKGIVHRDLKPSNILLDSHGNPKVIDFGVARAADPGAGVTAAETEMGQIVGSLQYMSPEQFNADPNDLDTRSDVYALGVILYELLRSELPYTLTRTSIYKAAQIVKDQEPARLSDGHPHLAGDLETVVHKALAKDRSQRYQSAHGLAKDLQRVLDGEAVAARPPSLSYQVQVFARKNKALIAGVAVAFIALLAGAAATTVLYLEAEEQREIAADQAKKAEAANEFLKEMITETIPRGYGQEPATVGDLLDVSSELAPQVLADQPQSEADICRIVGWGYLRLSDIEESYKQLKRAYDLRIETLGKDNPANLEAMSDFARISYITGRDEQGTKILEDIVALSSAHFGKEDRRTINARLELAANYAELGRIRNSQDLAQHVVEDSMRMLGSEDELTYSAKIFAAAVQTHRGELAEAEKLGKEILSRCVEVFGEEHELTRSAKSQVAATLLAKSRISEAAAVYHRKLPDNLGVTKELQGSIAPGVSGTRVLVFWESWCPFSQRAMPKLDLAYQQYRNLGLEVVGLTQVSKTSTEAQVLEYIREHDISFPILRIDGDLSKYFNQPGTPYIAVMHDGSLVWENYSAIGTTVPNMILDSLTGRQGS